MAGQVMLRSALVYASWNWPVFPLVPGQKRPLTTNGVLDATTDKEQIAAWWTRHPAANIGLACGTLIAIDLDVKPEVDGRETWRELGIPDNGAVWNLTPTGGQHIVFLNTSGKHIANSAGKIGPGIDVRGDGGYIILPPSIHPNGKPYAWDVAAHPADRKPAPIPPKLLDLLLVDNGRSYPTETPPHIPNGERNQALASLAGTMRYRGLTAAEILPSLWAVNTARCRPPLDRKEVEKIAQSAARYKAKKPLPAIDPVPEPAPTAGDKAHWTRQHKDRWNR